MYRGGRGPWRGAPAPARGGYARGRGPPHKRAPPPPAAGSSHRQWKRVRAEDAPQLPVLQHRRAIVDAVSAHAVVVVEGDTGCGKSTQVPQFLLDADPAARIACTQPRRLATKTLAQRVSRERAKQLGQEVGYAVSREQVVTRGATRCTFLTVGLLLQMLIFERRRGGARAAVDGARAPDAASAAEPESAASSLPYTHIVVDEAHERSCEMDLLLLLLRRIVHEQHTQRPRRAHTDGDGDGDGDGGGDGDGDGGGDGADAAGAVRAVGAGALSVSVGGAGTGGDERGAGARALRVVVMSATIDVARLAEYFAVPPPLSAIDAVTGLAVRVERPRLHVPRLSVGGGLHPVAVCYLEDVLLADARAAAERGGERALSADARLAIARELKASQPVPAPPGAPARSVRLQPALWALVAQIIRSLPLLLPGLCDAAASRELRQRSTAAAAAAAADDDRGARTLRCGAPAADAPAADVTAVRASSLPPFGSTLVFLPGVAEISELMRALAAAPPLAPLAAQPERAHVPPADVPPADGASGGGVGAASGRFAPSGAADAAARAPLHVLPLHALLEPAEQDLALAPATAGSRKVILATNVGESSLTVPDVAYVLDLGLEKLPFLDARANMESLLLQRASVASARQRAGRCGRVGPGLCLRLFSAALMPAPRDEGETRVAADGAAADGGNAGWSDGRLPLFTVPEMQRISLASLVLKAKLIEPASSAGCLLAEALQPPDVAALTAATAELVGLGALSAGGRAVTPLGALVAALPCSAQMGRLCVLGDALGLGRQGALLAAALSLPDPFVLPFRDKPPPAQPQLQPQPHDRAAGGGGGGGGGGGVPGGFCECALGEWQFAAADVLAYRRRLELFATSGSSEPLAVLAVHAEWSRLLQSEGPPAAARYCKTVHISYKRLVELDCLARELAQRLAAQRHALRLPPPAPPATPPGARPPPLALLALLVVGFAPQLAVATAAAYARPPPAAPGARTPAAGEPPAAPAPADAVRALAHARAAFGIVTFAVRWPAPSPSADAGNGGGAPSAGSAAPAAGDGDGDGDGEGEGQLLVRELLTAATVSSTLAPCGPTLSVEIALRHAQGDAAEAGGADGGAADGGQAGAATAERPDSPDCPRTVGRVTVRFATQQGAQLALRMCGLKGSLPLLPPGVRPQPLGQPAPGARGGARGGGRGVGVDVPLGATVSGADATNGCAAEPCAHWLELAEPRYAPHLRFQRQAVAAACAAGVGHSAEPFWQSGGCALADPPPPLRAATDALSASACERSRFLLAASWSAAGYARRLHVAHWPTLLPASPFGLAHILLLGLCRRVLLIPNKARSRVVGAWLGSADDSLGIELPHALLSADIDEVNALRLQLSQAVGDPSAAPVDGPLPMTQLQHATEHATPPPSANGQSAAAVQGALLRLLAKQRAPASDADRAQAAAAIGAALEAIKAGGDASSAIDAERAAESIRLGANGWLLPPLVSPLYDYSPEEMDGFR